MSISLSVDPEKVANSRKFNNEYMYPLRFDPVRMSKSNTHLNYNYRYMHLFFQTPSSCARSHKKVPASLNCSLLYLVL